MVAIFYFSLSKMTTQQEKKNDGFFTPHTIPSISCGSEKFLIWGNLVFLLPILFFGLSPASVLTLCIGIVSFIFHSQQCACKEKTNSDHVHSLCLFDIFGVSILAFIVILCFWKDIPLHWWILWPIPLLFLYIADHNVSGDQYAKIHGSWHVMAGLLLTKLFFLKSASQ